MPVPYGARNQRGFTNQAASSPAAPGAGGFDPATLDLSLWVRGSYATSPWNGETSTGASASYDLTSSIGLIPGVGTASGGYNSADFDGTDDEISNTTVISTFLTSTAWSCWVLFWADAVPAQAGAVYEDPALVAAINRYFGLHLGNDGVNDQVKVYQSDSVGGVQENKFTISTGQWNLIQAKYDNANIRARLNSGSWVDVPSTYVFDLSSGGVVVGKNGGSPSPDAWFNGKIMDLALSDTELSDSDMDNVKDYINSQYVLSL